jgi:branched-chain amino acid transport system substrate-binding protein
MRRLSVVAAILAAGSVGAVEGPKPVLIGLDLEFGHKTSTSDDAIRRGVLVAIDEVNAAGGVLGGRPLAVVERDHRSVPARGVENIRELAEFPDMVAVVCGKFSPVVLEELPVLHEKSMILLSPWAAADGIIDHGHVPSYTFRLSLRDDWVARAMVKRAGAHGYARLGVLLPNTAWGRGNKAALDEATRAGPVKVVATRWYNWGVQSFATLYADLVRDGAQAIVFIGNEGEAVVLLRELAELPRKQRLPVLAHHGVMGGDLAAMAGASLKAVDLVIAQPFLFTWQRAPEQRVLATARRLFGVEGPRQLPSPAGLAAAYDLTHLLARAIDRAGSTRRADVRAALERLGPYDGLVRTLERPFAPDRHEALGPGDVRFGRFDEAGLIKPAEP